MSYNASRSSNLIPQKPPLVSWHVGRASDAKPNLEANNDKLVRREPVWEDVSEGSDTQSIEETLSEDDDVVAMLLRGETLSNF